MCEWQQGLFMRLKSIVLYFISILRRILISAVTGVLSYKAINDDSKENENDVKPHILSFL